MSTKPKFPGMPPAHPAADFFSLHEGEPLHILAERIKLNGLLEPIVMLDGLILDGRRRWRACIMAGVEPITMDFYDRPESATISPADWVWDKNFARRQLGLGEQAIAAARYKQYLRDHPNGERLADVGPKAGVAKTTLDKAEKVLAKAEPEVVAAVESGEVSLNDAAKIVDEKPKVQRSAVKDVMDRLEKTATASVAKAKPTNGQPVFDDKRISEPFGKLYRACTERWQSMGQKPDEQFDAVKAALKAINELLSAWGVK